MSALPKSKFSQDGVPHGFEMPHMPEFIVDETVASVPFKMPMTSADYYHLIRQRMQNEDDLVNQRLIWMVFSQSFLFSGFAILSNAPEKAKNVLMSSQQDLLMWIIPLVAFTSSIIIFVGIIASLLSVTGLRKMYEQYPQDNTVAYYPPIQNLVLIRRLSLLAPVVLPLLFITTWVLILFNQFIQSGQG